MSRRLRRIAGGLIALALSACATLPPQQPSPPTSMSRLPGWDREDHVAAFAAARQACAASPRMSRAAVCAEVLDRSALGEAAARSFLETHFRAVPIEGEGLLTGYFSPSYEARTAPEGDFTAPLRPSPADPTALDRVAIERAPAQDALAWMRPEDLFFLQVQGSGTLTFETGVRRRAVFAAANGRTFVAIAKTMIAEGLLDPANASADAVRAWLVAHRGPDAQAQMDQDPRYIFFRMIADNGGEPRGASGAELSPGRSLAVDPTEHAYFELLWVDAHAGSLSGAHPSYQRLAVALDRGGAIVGSPRADLYVGSGARAGYEAARIRHTLRLYRIVPVQP